jgi:hypothetical protein
MYTNDSCENINKKCCVLISGTVRLYDIYLTNFLNNLKKSNKNLTSVDVIISLNSSNINEDVIKTLNPKKIFYNEVKVDDKYLNINKNIHTNLFNTYSMFFNNYKAFKLLE